MYLLCICCVFAVYIKLLGDWNQSQITLMYVHAVYLQCLCCVFAVYLQCICCAFAVYLQKVTYLDITVGICSGISINCAELYKVKLSTSGLVPSPVMHVFDKLQRKRQVERECLKVESGHYRGRVKNNLTETKMTLE